MNLYLLDTYNLIKARNKALNSEEYFDALIVKLIDTDKELNNFKEFLSDEFGLIEPNSTDLKDLITELNDEIKALKIDIDNIKDSLTQIIGEY